MAAPTATKAALVIGASRGIGRQIAVTLSQNGYKVGVAAKTTSETQKTPGTIYSVAEEIKNNGGDAIAIPCNVRRHSEVEHAVKSCLDQFGRLDFAVYNAGAIMWEKVLNTPISKFDLMMDVNVRGAYCMIRTLLPYFLQERRGKMLMISPPIYSRFFKGKTPYAISKIGMTILTNGLGYELRKSGVSIVSLWPATVIQSHVTNVKNIPKNLMRTSDIFADACLHIAEDKSDALNGQALIDEDYLRSIGVTDFSKYRCDPEQEPPRMMPVEFPNLLVAEEQESLTKKSKL